MSSKDSILAAVKANQPEKVSVPDIHLFETAINGSLEKFATALTGVGGKIAYVSGYDEITRLILLWHGRHARIKSEVEDLTLFSNSSADDGVIRGLHDVDVAILSARFGVAENGAVWLTENEMRHRILPFICQHLAVVLNANTIVPTMHNAYELISKTTYAFGTFIAGPSKTADIEQSLVIGAHGPRSMTVFVLNQEPEF